MEMEIVSKILQVLLLHKFAQVVHTVTEMETVSQNQFQFHAQVDGNLIHKVDVFHWLLILQLKFQLQDAQTVLHQMEQEDVFHVQYYHQSHALQVSWVTEMETVSLCQHQFQLFHQLLQVLAHAKVQLMNYNKKSQFCKQLLLLNHSQLLNHKQLSDHQIQYPVPQVEIQIFK